ncbi:AAA domain-containing protein [Promethearchaeum syntrophicum]|uniref:AAA domain-containing protein n=1 Tax=Promethearchaeum syntrophicum TaxID=2594042 RepID=A0A5B9DC92_9ARCH|nr:AAA domain-containing protein [Candidatus Prometheoarchaeum syntrophicum]QEE16661.1 ATP-dependent RecD-like DNA helicase [Candidatus Prometheoarchaeum syntrophicum]
MTEDEKTIKTNKIFKIFKIFKEIKGKISINQPVICSIDKILKYNEKENFLTVLIEDQVEEKVLAFFYGYLSKILNSESVQRRLPLKITIIKGELKKLDNKKQYFEIHQAILDKDTYINSSWIGSYNYCEMQSFLNIYINAYSRINENLLWGNLFHDYLSIIFSNPNLELWVKKRDILEKNVLTSFSKACYMNWGYFVSLRIDLDFILKEFQNNFLQNEIDFIQKELEKYSEEYGKYEIICEKMIYSKNLGIQGRIDRLIQTIPSSRFVIIETKTGTSPSSSQISAFYQSMAYATILQEYFPTKVDKLLIEYPRLSINERMLEYNYDEKELLKVLKIRNEIWNILMGNQPEVGDLHTCGRCSSKDACNFHKYRLQMINSEGKRVHNNPFQEIFEKSAQKQALFKRLNAYMSWFLYHLDNEFNYNIQILKELQLSSEEREKKGNCIANLQFNSILIKNKEKLLSFSMIGRQIIKNTRIRVGDYVLITPQEFIPLTSESIRGIIKDITKEKILISIFREIKSEKQFQSRLSYRIDLTSSNYMIDLQKQAIDKLCRFSVSPYYPNIRKLRDLLLFRTFPKIGKVDEEFVTFDDSFSFDLAQQQAISLSMKSEDMVLIQGPPGTGKTTIIAEIANRLVQKFRKNKNKNLEKKTKKKSGLDYFIKNGKKTYGLVFPILISAFTNKAVDNILLKIIERFPDLKVIRIGKISSNENPMIKKHSIEHVCQEMNVYPTGEKEIIVDPFKVRAVLKNADIICTTTTSAANILLENSKFDTIILDEAAQIVESSGLIPLLKGDHFILVGDHQQLPPISQGKEPNIPKESVDFLEILNFSPEKGLGVSIFERLSSEFYHSPSYIMLSNQYRMNKIISKFVSDTFYEGKLEPGIVNGKNIGDQTFSDFLLDNGLEGFNFGENDLWGQFFNPTLPMIFIDTINIDAKDSSEYTLTKELTSKFNQKEAEIIVRVIAHFFKEIAYIYKDIDKLIHILKKIGIISGYRAQNQKIHEELLKYFYEHIFNSANIPKFSQDEKNLIFESIIIDTVDRFQGQEREFIIYSFVDSNPQHTIEELNMELRRLNVAISRVKKKIIFVGNSPTLNQTTPNTDEKTKFVKNILKELIIYIKDHNGYFIIEY